MSDTQTAPAEWHRTTPAPRPARRRLGRMMCNAASVPTNTHSHQVLPRHPRRGFRRKAPMSWPIAPSPRIAPARSPAAAPRARASMLLMAPSLIERANNSPIRAASRSSPRWSWSQRGTTNAASPTGRTGQPAPACLARAAVARCAAASAPAAKQAHPRHVRLDRPATRSGSNTRCGVCCSAGKTVAQWGQTSSLASTTRSGFGSSARPTPGRLLRARLSLGWTIATSTPRRRQRRIVGGSSLAVRRHAAPVAAPIRRSAPAPRSNSTDPERQQR